MEETNLYDLPKDMLIKIITTIQDCKNLNDKQLLKNSKINLIEVEKRKLDKIKEFLVKEDLAKLSNVSELIKNIAYIRIRLIDNSLSSRMIILFTDKTNIRVIKIGDNLMISIFDANNKQLHQIFHGNSLGIPLDIQEDNTGKYKEHITFISTLLIPNFSILNNYLHPFTAINPFNIK